MTINRFTRHPKTTITTLMVLAFVVLDLTLGAVFCPRIVGTPDAYYHHDLPKNFSGTKPWGGKKYRVFTNSLGFIDRSSREVSKEAQKHRILLMGDSFVEGVGLEYDQTFAGLLAAQLAPYDVEILNAGVTSYSPKLYYLKTKYLLQKVGLGFDELFVFIDISDIQDEIFYSDFIPKGDVYSSSDYLLNKINSILKRRSLTYYVFQNMYEESAYGGEKIFGITLDFINQVHNVEWEFERPHWTIDKRIFDAWGEVGLTMAGHYIERLKKLCDENDIEMHLVVYPWPVQIKFGDLDSIQVTYWQNLSRKHGIDFINYFPLFIGDDEKTPESVYAEFFIEGDVHWNEKGHRLVADVLLEKWISRHGAKDVSRERWNHRD